MLSSVSKSAASKERLQWIKMPEQKWTEQKWFVHLKYLFKTTEWFMNETPLQLRQCRYEKRKQERQIRERTRLSCLSVGSNRCLLFLWWVAKEWRKKWSPHLTLEELRSDGHPATVRGQWPHKKPRWIIRGDFCYKKGAGCFEKSRLRALDVWRYCSWWISEPSKLYFHISKAACPPRLWMQAGRECPWISLETCSTDRTNARPMA